jgi:hypothetical protein
MTVGEECERYNQIAIFGVRRNNNPRSAKRGTPLVLPKVSRLSLATQARRNRARSARVFDYLLLRNGYSLHTLRQASRRSWRTGQIKPVQIKFLMYSHTVQENQVTSGIPQNFL